jgi:hypothetical protein
MREVEIFFSPTVPNFGKATVSTFGGVQVAPTSLWYKQYKHTEKYCALGEWYWQTETQVIRGQPTPAPLHPRQPKPPQCKTRNWGRMLTHITYNNSVCTSHRVVWTLLPDCHIEVLTAYGNKGAQNENTTKPLCFIITIPHSNLHLNWWCVNVIIHLTMPQF